MQAYTRGHALLRNALPTLRRKSYNKRYETLTLNVVIAGRAATAARVDPAIHPIELDQLF
jgi:hypothetical protein